MYCTYLQFKIGNELFWFIFDHFARPFPKFMFDIYLLSQQNTKNIRVLYRTKKEERPSIESKQFPYNDLVFGMQRTSTDIFSWFLLYTIFQTL